MVKPEVFRSSGVLLDRVNNVPPSEGYGKLVYKMTDGTNTIAAKLWKPNDWALPVSKLVKREMYANKLLRKTPLKDYIPEALFPLKDVDGETVGLAVKWEDGIALSKLGNEVPLSSIDFDRFESAVLSACNMGITPDYEIIKPYNVLFNPNRTPKLWIAESDIAMLTTELDQESYLSEFADAMSRVEEYVTVNA